MGLIEKYDLKGAGAWALGQEDTSIWDHYEEWVNRPEADAEQTPPTTPPQPEAPVFPEQPSQGYFYHQVQSGDSLWKIAQQYLGQGSRYVEVMQLNGLTSDRIYPGMELKIPGTEENMRPEPEITYREYTVKQGDSLWKIARAYLGSGTRYSEIVELNGLKSEIIHPGQTLKLPKN